MKLLMIVLLLTACGDPRPCEEWAEQTVVTYPYAGMMSLGPSYAALALQPVFVKQTVCVRRAP